MRWRLFAIQVWGVVLVTAATVMRVHLAAFIMAVVLLIVSVLRLPESSDASGIPAVPASLLGVLQFATALVALFVPLAAGLYLLTTAGTPSTAARRSGLG